MARKKAEISLNEWLKRGVGSSEMNQAKAADTKGEQTATPCPTVTEGPTEVKVEPVAVTSADVAGPKDGGVEWFWLLLEQSDYERW